MNIKIKNLKTIKKCFLNTRKNLNIIRISRTILINSIEKIRIFIHFNLKIVRKKFIWRNSYHVSKKFFQIFRTFPQKIFINRIFYSVCTVNVISFLDLNELKTISFEIIEI